MLGKSLLAFMALFSVMLKEGEVDSGSSLSASWVRCSSPAIHSLAGSSHSYSKLQR